MSDINQAIELSPEKVTPWVNRALIHAAAGDDPAMHADFERALSLGIKPTYVLSWRANAHWRRGEYDKAHLDYAAILEYEPENLDAILYIASILIGHEDYDQATAHLERAAAVLPDEAPIHMMLGQLHYYHAGNYQAALQALNVAVKIDLSNDLGHFYLGTMHFKLGNIDAGKQNIEKYVDIVLDQEEVSSFRDLSKIVGRQLLLGASHRHLLKGTAYALAGQRTLAREAFDQFVDDGGWPASIVVEGLLDEFGTDSAIGGRGTEEGQRAMRFERLLDHLESPFTLKSLRSSVAPKNMN